MSHWRTSYLVVVGHVDGKLRAAFNASLHKIFSGHGVPIKHCSNPSSEFFAVLRARPTDVQQSSQTNTEVERNQIVAGPYDNFSLDLISLPGGLSNNPQGSLIMDRTGQLTSLGNYLKMATVFVCSDWKTHNNLPSRFVASINETLAEKEEGTLAQNLYNLAMTGHCSPTMIEWLRDELAERVSLACFVSGPVLTSIFVRVIKDGIMQ